MGSSLRRFFGITSNMYKQVFISFLACASSLPIEDTPEVAAAKADFSAAFATAEAGEHIALRPVNNDVQAPQIASAYLDDIEDVAAAKAAFQAAFDDASTGGLASLQATAPLHVLPEPAPLAAAPVVAAPTFATNVLGYAGIPYNNGLGYYSGYPTLGYSYAGLGHLPYAGLGHFPYAGLPIVAAPAAKE